jgi:hypothetical protein
VSGRERVGVFFIFFSWTFKKQRDWHGSCSEGG